MSKKFIDRLAARALGQPPSIRISPMVTPESLAISLPAAADSAYPLIESKQPHAAFRPRGPLPPSRSSFREGDVSPRMQQEAADGSPESKAGPQADESVRENGVSFVPLEAGLMPRGVTDCGYPPDSAPSTDAPADPEQSVSTNGKAEYGAEMTAFVRNENEVPFAAEPDKAMQIQQEAIGPGQPFTGDSDYSRPQNQDAAIAPSHMRFDHGDISGPWSREKSAPGIHPLATSFDKAWKTSEEPLKGDSGTGKEQSSRALSAAGGPLKSGNRPDPFQAAAGLAENQMSFMSHTAQSGDESVRSGNRADPVQNTAGLAENQMPLIPHRAESAPVVSAGRGVPPSGKPGTARDTTTERPDREDRRWAPSTSGTIRNPARSGPAGSGAESEQETMPAERRSVRAVRPGSTGITEETHREDSFAVSADSRRDISLSLKQAAISRSRTNMPRAVISREPHSGPALNGGETSSGKNHAPLRPAANARTSRPAALTGTKMRENADLWRTERPQSSAVMSFGEREPSVVVRIGRIDVRADTPPAAAPVREVRRGPTLSLDQYLRQRRGRDI